MLLKTFKFITFASLLFQANALAKDTHANRSPAYVSESAEPAPFTSAELTSLVSVTPAWVRERASLTEKQPAAAEHFTRELRLLDEASPSFRSARYFR